MASPFPLELPPSETRKISSKSSKLLMKTTSATAEAGIKILPKEGEANVLVTSALPYVNNVPHLGNIIGSTLSADVYARYSRTRNRNTLYICGTDEYGTATETKALEEKVSPQALCDKYHALHAEVYKWFNIGFDHFGRTTTPKQTEICQEVFLKLLENDCLEKRTMTQLYCESCERFLADRYVEGICPRCSYEDARGDQCDKCGQLLDAIELKEPRCKLCSSRPVLRDSAHMFILMDKLQPEVEKWARQACLDGGWSSNGRIITESWFKEGLRPFSLTRDLKWGVQVPQVKGTEDIEGKVFYVWFDAPIGYPSITANYTDDWRTWWQNPDNVKLYQFMGKDNVRFHTVIFPSCLLGTKEPWTLLHHISTTEYLQYESGKFSKSRNIGVFGDKASTIGVPSSVWRYYLIRNRPEKNDTHFKWQSFVDLNNGELLANLGNFVNRVLSFCVGKYDGVLPEVPSGLGLTTDGPLKGSGENEHTSFIRDVNETVSRYVSEMDAVHLRKGLETVMELSSRGNDYLSRVKMQTSLFKEQRAECDAVMLLAINLIWVLSVLVHPFMPETADQICQQLDAPARAVPFEEDDSADGVAVSSEEAETETGGEDFGKSGAASSSRTAKVTRGRGLFALDLLPGHKLGKPFHLFTNIDAKTKPREWTIQFGGEEAAKAAALADAPSTAPSGVGKTGAGQQDGQSGLSKKAMAKLEKERKKEAAAAKAALQPLNKTPEMIELEKQVKDQGEAVRQAKEAVKKGGEAAQGVNVDGEVSKLLKLKHELDDLTDKVKAMEVKEQVDLKPSA